jgi:hypothetical protein
LKRFIRDQRAIDTLISYGALVETVSKRFNREFDQRYIDRTTIEERMAFTRENYRRVREELLKILYRTPENDTSGVPKPLAATEKKSPRTSELALLQAEIANGMYKKPLDAIVKEHLRPATR